MPRSPERADPTPRRGFIVGVTAAIIARLLTIDVTADTKSRRIGILSPHKAGPVSGAFAGRLADRGWRIDYISRHAEGRLDRLPSLAAELVRLNVDVLFTDGASATKAARDATTTIPVVFVGISFPVEAGVIASLARPGGNVTGATDQTGDLLVKLLQLINDTVPTTRRFAFFVDADHPSFTARVMQAIEEMARARDLTMLPVRVSTPADVDAGFAACARERIGAAIVHVSPTVLAERHRIGALAQRNRLPTFTMGRGMIEAGLLMSYHSDWHDVLVQAANQVDRIFLGARPRDLPVVQPTRFEFVINMKTARSLGLSIPPSLLMRADEVIQ